MSKIVVVMTCYNRCDKTVNCIKKLHMDCDENIYRYYVVDDKSTDNTVEMINKLGFDDVFVVEGTGSLFWNGGMHRGVEVSLTREENVDYVLLVNDDVDFEPGCIDRMVAYLNKLPDKGDNTVLVGPTKGDDGKLSYGGIKYSKGINYEMHGPDKGSLLCDTFNANCTLIPYEVMKKAGNLDPYYKHSMGDFDLGLRISRAGSKILIYPEYIGICNDNPVNGTWRDSSLPVFERIKLKESFKGLPFGDWFHFLRKNFGLPTAVVRSISPYIKIFLHR